MALRLLLWLGTESARSAVWLAWLLTYLAHSVLAAFVVAALARVRALSSATRDLCWKGALFGPLVTAFLAVSLGGGQWHVRTASYVRDLTRAPGPVVPARQALPAVSSGLQALHVHASLVLGIALGCALLGLLRFVGSALFLRYRLRSRAHVVDRELLERLERLRRRMGVSSVRLTECAQVCSPLVLGSSEICMPRRLSAGLSGLELDSVLAHELAHLERSDGIWFLVIGALQSLLWLNPLNHWLASYCRESAELACDDRAVEVTRDPLGLARALVQVATSASFRHRLVTTPTMARSKSAILPRVSRLTCGSAVATARSNERGRLGAIATLTVLAAALGSVSVQVARANPQSARSARARVVSHTVAPAPDVTEQSARMAGLATRERSVVAQLTAVQTRAACQTEGSADSVRALELEQELRHLRENQAWLEAQFVTEWHASTRDRPRALPASR